MKPWQICIFSSSQWVSHFWRLMMRGQWKLAQGDEAKVHKLKKAISWNLKEFLEVTRNLRLLQSFGQMQCLARCRTIPCRHATAYEGRYAACNPLISCELGCGIRTSDELHKELDDCSSCFIHAVPRPILAGSGETPGRMHFSCCKLSQCMEFASCANILEKVAEEGSAPQVELPWASVM